MLNRDFVFEEDHELGFQGLRATWMDNAQPFDGMGCAHDMLEHFPMQHGAIEGECEALGAHMFLRLENGWSASTPTSWQATWFRMGNLLSTCLIDGENESLDPPRFFKTKPLSESTEHELQKALDKAFDDARANFRDEPEALARFDEPLLRASYECAVRRGYRKAARRYARVDTYNISSQLFAAVAKTLDTLMKNYLELGDRVGVSLNLNTCQIFTRINGRRVREDYLW